MESASQNLQTTLASQVGIQTKQSADEITDILSAIAHLSKLRIDSLFDEALRFLRRIVANSTLMGQLKDQSASVQCQFNELKEDIEKTMAELEFQLAEMKLFSHTDSHRINDHLVISYKMLESTNMVTIKAEAELDVPWFNMVALIYEVDLFKSWFPFCANSFTVQRPRKAMKIGYFEMKLPFISNRDAYISGMGIDRLSENGTILIMCKTIHEEAQLLKDLKIDLTTSKNVQIKLNFMTCEITPLQGNKVRVTTLSNVDPNVTFLPKWMLNYFTKKFGTYLIEKMLRLAKDIRVDNKPFIYLANQLNQSNEQQLQRWGRKL